MAKKPETSTPDADPVGRFEDAMQELESIVQGLERGDLRLEESMKLFERGVELGRQCRRALDTAELKVRNLLDADDQDGAST